MAKRTAKRKAVIGWREWVALPDFGVPWVKAKVDTGARTSSLHAYDIRHYRDDERDMVRFTIHPLQRDNRTAVSTHAELVDLRTIRNPGGGGREETRPVVRTRVQLMDRTWEIELTLTRRDHMGFRMLLGRQAVRRSFVVDPGRSFLAGKPPAGAFMEVGS